MSVDDNGQPGVDCPAGEFLNPAHETRIDAIGRCTVEALLGLIRPTPGYGDTYRVEAHLPVVVEEVFLRHNTSRPRAFGPRPGIEVVAEVDARPDPGVDLRCRWRLREGPDLVVCAVREHDCRRAL